MRLALKLALWTIGACVVAVAAIASVAAFSSFRPDSGRPIFPLLLGMVVLAWVFGVVVIFLRHHSAAPTSTLVAGPPAPSERPASRALAVMFIDLEGYTAATAIASRAQLMELLDRLREVVRPILNDRHGRVIKTAGDGFLVTFESPTNAILAGDQVLAAAKQTGMRLRIGIATGEVTLAHGDIFGDAVNLAHRIQQLASPEQVCFSESTWHAMNKAEIDCEDGGVHELKGITSPVRVFRTRQRRQK